VNKTIDLSLGCRIASCLMLLVAGSSAHAACSASDRPPAPTQVKFFATGDTSVYAQWAVRPNDFVDMTVRQKSNNKTIFNVAGGLKRQWEKAFSDLAANQEYELTIRSRTESGTNGCVSTASITLTTKTATKGNAGVCRTYVARALQQVKTMEDLNCPHDGGRWSKNANHHWQWCIDQRGQGQAFDVSENKARDDAIAACRAQKPQAASCPPNRGDPVPPEWADMLAAHNERRKLHCACPLTWSASLANGAQTYASECKLGQHGSSGENLADRISVRDDKPVLPAATDREAFEQSWYCERDNYSYDNPQFTGGFTRNCGRGDNPKVNGHFTQVVWKDSTQLGCGRATCSMTITLDEGTPKERKIQTQGTHWVCRYSPPGNAGTDSANLKRKVSAPVCK